MELAQKYDMGMQVLVEEAYTNRVIWPSQKAHVFFEWEGKPAIAPMTWGFSEKNWLYNARSDSLHKYAWRGPFATNRCVIPLVSFHEGKKDFVPQNFSSETDPPLYVAGMYGLLGGNGTTAENRFMFTMITTKANMGVFPYHNRMPLLLGEQHLLDWCNPLAPGEDVLAEAEIFTDGFRLEVAA